MNLSPITSRLVDLYCEMTPLEELQGDPDLVGTILELRAITPEAIKQALAHASPQVTSDAVCTMRDAIRTQRQITASEPDYRVKI